MGMGSALISDLLFNFYSKDKNLSHTETKTLLFLSKVVWIALSFIILSGVGLFLSNPEKYMASAKFISKMFIMVVLLVNGVFLHQIVSPHFEDRGLLRLRNKRPFRQIAFACGAISILSWVVVCVLGILSSIPYTFMQFIFAYLLVLVIAILVSLVVEKYTFSR